MSDDRDLDDLAESLFKAGRAEPSPPEGRARLLAALGIDGPGGGGGSGSGGIAFKAVAVASAIGIVALGVWLGMRAPEVTKAPAAPAPTPVLSVSETLGGPAVPASVEPAPTAFASSDLPSAPTTSSVVQKPTSSAPLPKQIAAHASAAPSASVVASASSAPANDLAAELAALDRARGLIRGTDYNNALAQLDTYAKDHPKGSLSQEALLLRIEALVGLGRKDEARKVAEPLLVRRTGDMAGDRARKLLER